jgi:hypothetical protein
MCFFCSGLADIVGEARVLETGSMRDCEKGNGVGRSVDNMINKNRATRSVMSDCANGITATEVMKGPNDDGLLGNREAMKLLGNWGT